MFKTPSTKHIINRHPGLSDLLKLVPDFWNTQVNHLVLTPQNDNTDYITKNYPIFFMKALKFSDNFTIIDNGNFWTNVNIVYKLDIGDYDIEFKIGFSNYTYSKSNLIITMHLQVQNQLAKSKDKNSLRFLKTQTTVKFDIGTNITHNTFIDLFDKLLNSNILVLGNGTHNSYQTFPHTLKQYLNESNIDCSLKSKELRNLIPYLGDKYPSTLKGRDHNISSKKTVAIPGPINIEPFEAFKHDRKKFKSKSASRSGPKGYRIPTIRLPKMRHVFPELTAHDITGVQPMDPPAGFTFALRHQYGGRDQERPRRLRATWGEELPDDLENMHGTDVNEEMVNIMSDELRAEIDRQLVSELVKESTRDKKPSASVDLSNILTPYIPLQINPPGYHSLRDLRDNAVTIGTEVHTQIEAEIIRNEA